MTENMIDIKEIKEPITVPDIYIVQWLHKRIDQNYVRNAVWIVLRSNLWDTGASGRYNMLRYVDDISSKLSKEELAFLECICKDEPLSGPSPSYEWKLICQNKDSHLKLAYIQYLIRIAFDDVIRDSVPLYLRLFLNLEEKDFVPFLVPPDIREKYFKPVYEFVTYEKIKSDPSRPYDLVFKDNVLPGTKTLDEIWEQIQKNSTTIRKPLPNLATLLWSDPVSVFRTKELNPLRLSYDDLTSEEFGKFFFFPPRFSSLVKWFKKTVDKSTVTKEKYEYLYRCNLSSYMSDVKFLYGTGTRARFPELCLRVVPEEGKDNLYSYLCRNFQEDPFLCALIAASTNYEDFSPGLQEEFFRMCHYAGIKAQTPYYDFTQRCDYTTRKYVDDPVVVLNTEAYLKSIVLDKKEKFKFRVYTNRKLGKGVVLPKTHVPGQYIVPKFDKTYDSFPEAMKEAIDIEKCRRQIIRLLYGENPDDQLEALNSEVRVHISIESAKDKDSD